MQLEKFAINILSEVANECEQKMFTPNDENHLFYNDISEAITEVVNIIVETADDSSINNR